MSSDFNQNIINNFQQSAEIYAGYGDAISNFISRNGTVIYSAGRYNNQINSSHLIVLLNGGGYIGNGTNSSVFTYYTYSSSVFKSTLDGVLNEVNISREKHTVSLGVSANQGGCSDNPTPWYGNFLGPGPDGPNANPLDLYGGRRKQYPIDAIDKGAQTHDVYYWKVSASGAKSAFTDLRTIDADRDLAIAGYKAWGNAILGNIDPVSGRDYTAKETLWSAGVALGFTFITAEKSFRIGVNEIITLKIQ